MGTNNKHHSRNSSRIVKYENRPVPLLVFAKKTIRPPAFPAAGKPSTNDPSPGCFFLQEFIAHPILKASNTSCLVLQFQYQDGGHVVQDTHKCVP
jgi:hypothetical protein